MNLPLVSVCLINSNGENCLNKSIDSVLEQTYKNIELIIIDNDSSDCSIDLIKSYNDKRIKLYKNTENLPHYSSVNKALKLAKGDLIATLESADKYEDTFLEEVVRHYKTYPTQKVFITAYYEYNDNSKKLSPKFPYKNAGTKFGIESFAYLTRDNNIGKGVNVVCHKECFDKIGYFSEFYNENANYDYWLRLALNYDFVFIPKFLVYEKIKEETTQTDSVEEKNSILEKHLQSQSFFSEEAVKKIISLRTAFSIVRSFEHGIKTKSGKETRKQIKYYKNNQTSFTYNPLNELIYALSYCADIKIPFIDNILIYIGKVSIAQYNKALNKLFDNFIENSRLIKIAEKMPTKDSCSKGCGTCSCK